MKLEITSPIDSHKYPFLFQWDSLYRQNHALYQTKIDELTFHLQKAQRSWFFLNFLFYPAFYENSFLLLDLYKKKQQLGIINQEEINEFKPINKGISSDLNKTFNASYYIPKTGLLLGAGTFVFGHFFNFQYSLRTGLFLIPVVADLWLRWTDSQAWVRTDAFLEFAIQYRKAKGRIEYNSARLDQRLLKNLRDGAKLNRPLDEYYEKVINLAKKQGGEWQE